MKGVSNSMTNLRSLWMPNIKAVIDSVLFPERFQIKRKKKEKKWADLC